MKDKTKIVLLILIVILGVFLIGGLGIFYLVHYVFKFKVVSEESELYSDSIVVNIKTIIIDNSTEQSRIEKVSINGLEEKLKLILKNDDSIKDNKIDSYISDIVTAYRKYGNTNNYDYGYNADSLGVTKRSNDITIKKYSNNSISFFKNIDTYKIDYIDGKDMLLQGDKRLEYNYDNNKGIITNEQALELIYKCKDSNNQKIDSKYIANLIYNKIKSDCEEEIISNEKDNKDFSDDFAYEYNKKQYDTRLKYLNENKNSFIEKIENEVLIKGDKTTVRLNTDNLNEVEIGYSFNKNNNSNTSGVLVANDNVFGELSGIVTIKLYE